MPATGSTAAQRAALLGKLMARSGAGARFGLDRMRTALATLGNPERSLRSVHVAGTNGKGSCCAMVEAVARAAGLRTGLYTSPHLCRFNERIVIDGRPVDDDLLGEALARALDPRLPELSFFEVLTTAALWAMREGVVELAVLEVGLGGRLDATNVVAAPECAAITSIGLDHTELLGPDLGSIAREKAGIIKPAAPLVVGPVAPAAAAAIAAAAADRGAGRSWWVGRDLGVRDTGHGLVVEGPDGLGLGPVRPGLPGSYQHGNVAVAVGVCWQLGARLPGLAGALGRGLTATRWPGRLERLRHAEVAVVLDCAHNPEGVAALCAALGPSDPERTVLVFGAMAEKAWPAMLSQLAPRARRRFYCEPLAALAGRHPVPPAAIARLFPGRPCRDPEHAWHAALAHADPGDMVLVTGSIYLVGAVRALLLGLERDVIVPL